MLDQYALRTQTPWECSRTTLVPHHHLKSGVISCGAAGKDPMPLDTGLALRQSPPDRFRNAISSALPSLTPRMLHKIERNISHPFQGPLTE